MRTDASKFVVSGGLDWGAAHALAAQIDTDDPKAETLISGECSDIQAVALTRQIIAQKVDEPLLIQFGFPPEFITAFKSALERKALTT